MPVSTHEISRSEELRNRKRITYFIWDLLLSQYAPSWVLWLLMSFLTEIRGETILHAAATVSMFEASTAVFSLLATLLMNNWLGQYFTTLLSTLLYATGLSLMCSIALPSETSNSGNTVLYTALFFCAMGKGGTSVAYQPFYDRQTRYYRRAAELYEENTLNWDMMVLYLIGLVLLLTGNVVLPYFTSWEILFGVPSLIMIFISYKLLRGYRTIFVPDQPQQPQVVSEDVNEERSWITLIPIWITFLMPALITSIGSTCFVGQANSLSTKVFGFLPLPVPSLLASFTLYMKQGKDRYTRQRQDPQLNIIKKYIPIKNVGHGVFFSILCCVIAAVVELKRIAEIKKHGSEEPIPMSLIWMGWQFSFLGHVYGSSKSGVKGFFNDQLPRRMHEYAGLFTDITFAVGTLLSVLVLNVAQMISSNGGKSDGWFGTTIKTTRLDYLYWTLAILSAINLLVFAMFASKYTYKDARPDEAQNAEDEERDNPVVDAYNITRRSRSNVPTLNN